MFDCELFGNLQTLHRQNIYFQNTYFPVQHHKAMKVIIQKSFYITIFHQNFLVQSKPNKHISRKGKTLKALYLTDWVKNILK